MSIQPKLLHLLPAQKQIVPIDLRVESYFELKRWNARMILWRDNPIRTPQWGLKGKVSRIRVEENQSPSPQEPLKPCYGVECLAESQLLEAVCPHIVYEGFGPGKLYFDSLSTIRDGHKYCRTVSSDGSSASHLPCAASFVLIVASTYSSVMAVSC